MKSLQRTTGDRAKQAGEKAGRSGSSRPNRDRETADSGRISETPKETELNRIQERANRGAGTSRAVQLHETAGGAKAAASRVTQLKLDRDRTADPTLQALIDTYNEQYEAFQKKDEGWFANTEAERRAALKTLHRIEISVYSYFDARNAQDLDVDPANIEMKTLMNGVQRERRDLVSLSISKNDKAPPVANFLELSPPEREKVSLIWRNLLKGNGISIKGNTEFTHNVLADFARLIENQFGRDLVHRIAIEKNALVITPTTLEQGKFVARPDNPDLEGFTLLPGVPQYPEDYLRIDPALIPKEDKLSIFRDVRRENPLAKGIALKLIGRTEYYQFNKGTGSSLPIPADAQDAKPNISSRLLGEGGREVIAPTFVNLAHELGHVLRSLLGISASQAGNQFIESAFGSLEGVTRPEEFFNINDIENSIRAENRISKREGHGNSYMEISSRLFGKMESWRRYIGIFKPGKYGLSFGVKANELEQRMFEIQGELQRILQARGGMFTPVYEGFAKAKALADELRDAFDESIVTSELPHLDEHTLSASESTAAVLDGHPETITGKVYEGSVQDLYLAIKEIAVDAGLAEYFTELQQEFKRGQPFVSEGAMIGAFSKALPPHRSSAAKRIAEYIVENSI